MTTETIETIEQLGSRPLLSRSGCICVISCSNTNFPFVLVPFYRGAVVFRSTNFHNNLHKYVLVPFYRGAVVFSLNKGLEEARKGSRPLLSRSGCIYILLMILPKKSLVLVPFYRGAVVFRTVRIILTFIFHVLVPFYRGAVVFHI